MNVRKKIIMITDVKIIFSQAHLLGYYVYSVLIKC